ncbi:tail fiber protein [Rhizobium ruizarguesonis]|uniref:tail fiber protein n=1 Tax=Rhizobium ruizarguesonis TaxID=2081791 RepID=UPI00102FF503|nr:tail fiber protein [Rhizobium ruizarguesonis]TBD34342.1 hypothetical protein ELH17_30620 [Rhizobium ruizarguesonis]TBD55052.1 hypothetical protein ELH16_34560 [Rhizobium ruizarguesonis]TBF01954.1 hypothetical protein ELG96_32410 [Rhizobium ruizarguesonis]
MRYQAAIWFLAVWLITLPAHSQNAPLVIPYQGKLSDQSGNPIDGSKKPITLVFRIYSTPVGGVPNWQEVHEDISVQDGYFSALLGSQTAFPDPTIFKGVVYLGITIDDGDPQTADVELRPRQAITPSIAAFQARIADDAARSQEAQHAQRADLALRATVADGVAGEVPIGGIVPFSGDPVNLPAAWRLCDGSLIDDPDSPLKGQTMPDLRGMFVRGVDSQTALGATGGQDSVPDHAHSFDGKGEVWLPMKSLNGWASDSVASPALAQAWQPNHFSLTFHDDKAGTDQETHGHIGSAYVSGITLPGGGHDNRPRFLSLNYIIRIK